MIRHRRSSRTVAQSVALSIGLGLGGLALTGCAAHDPGTAFSVGERSVSRDTVDTVVRAQCSLLADAGRQQGQRQVQPRSKLTWTIVDAMYQAAQENAYGEAYGVSYDDTQLRQAQTQLASEADSLPEDQADALTTAIVDVVRGQLITQSVGKQVLEKRGVANPGQDQAGAAGLQRITAWADGQGTSINPRYDVDAAGKPGSGDGSISTAVSSFAKSAASGSPSASFVSQLPPSQRCG